MLKLLIGNKLFFAENEDEVIALVDEHMGHDTADALNKMILEHECGGECDETYRLQEHYERVIRDAVDELREMPCAARYQPRMERIIRALEAEL